MLSRFAGSETAVRTKTIVKRIMWHAPIPFFTLNALLHRLRFKKILIYLNTTNNALDETTPGNYVGALCLYFSSLWETIFRSIAPSVQTHLSILSLHPVNSLSLSLI